MKKINLTFSFLILFVFSCQDVPDAKITNLNSFEDMNKITNELITFNASNFSTYITKESDGSFWWDNHQMAVSSFEHLDGNLIDAKEFDFNSLLKPFRKERIDINTMSSRIMNFNYGNFNMPQTWFADKLITDLLAVDNLYEVTNVVFSFNLQVLNSLLTQQEKDELLLLSSTALSMRDFLLNGGADMIFQEMVIAFGDPTNPSFGGRILGCSIDTRTVFHGAVLGLTWGAAKGAFTGATVGTVVPGAGNISGALAGAVIGGAIGFVEGAILGGIGSLLYTCFR